MDMYQENGYVDRNDYLHALAEDFGVDEDVVFAIADLYGPTEDFDGLVTALEDYDA